MYCIERNGDEPAVLCVHGYCQSSAYWAPTVERLARAGIRALAPDLPGFGDSAGLSGPYTIEAYVDALAQLLDTRNLTQIILVGGSMGGVVAQHFALRHPTRLLRLLLVATGAVLADPETALAKADTIAAEPWDEDAVRPFVQGFFRRPLSAADFDRYRRIALMASQQSAVEASRSNAKSTTLDRLNQITVPTLIIQGRHDRVRTPEHGADMRDRIPGARLEVLEESGHTPQLEEPEAFHKIALPFMLEGR